MPLAEILERWQPGSHPEPWTWDDERTDLYTNPQHRGRTLTIEASILADGIRDRVLLGCDGRVWDGHHRLVIAMSNSIDRIPVEHATGKHDD